MIEREGGLTELTEEDLEALMLNLIDDDSMGQKVAALYVQYNHAKEQGLSPRIIMDSSGALYMTIGKKRKLGFEYGDVR